MVDFDEGPAWENSFVHLGPLLPPPLVTVPDIKIIVGGELLDVDQTSTNNPLGMSLQEALYILADHVRNKRETDEVFSDNFLNSLSLITDGAFSAHSLDEIDLQPFLESDVPCKELQLVSPAHEKVKVDGYDIPATWRIFRSGVFTGKGHNKRGTIRRRLTPEDFTINCSEGAVPPAFLNGKTAEWGKVVCDKEAVWTSRWTDPVTKRSMYTGVERDSDPRLSGRDHEKFERARRLSSKKDMFREAYMLDLKSTDSHDRKLAVAAFFLDRLALRPGSSQSGGKGICNLSGRNVRIRGKNITLSFMGKSSVPFYETLRVPADVLDEIKNIKAECKEDSKFLPRVTSSELNKYVRKILSGEFSAKDFRTEKASKLFEKELESKKDAHLAIYHARKSVAEHLNHRNKIEDEKEDHIRQKIEEITDSFENSTGKERQKLNRSLRYWEARLSTIADNYNLSTSWNSYIDPRIVVAWAKREDVPIEELLSKKQLLRFVWAMDTPPNWTFSC